MGKGDWRRPTLADEKEVAENYCRTFGHRPGPRGETCLTCGVKLSSPVPEYPMSGRCVQ